MRTPALGGANLGSWPGTGRTPTAERNQGCAVTTATSFWHEFETRSLDLSPRGVRVGLDGSDQSARLGVFEPLIGRTRPAVEVERHRTINAVANAEHEDVPQQVQIVPQSGIRGSGQVNAM
jgi:hypothetical protein